MTPRLARKALFHALGALLARIPGAALYALASVATVAALTHLVVVLLIPEFAEKDAFSRVSTLGAVNDTALLPAADSGERQFPFLDPAFAGAICRYDLSNGPLRVTLPLGRPGFVSLSFHSRRGVTFFALTDRAATQGKLEAIVVTPAELRVLEAHDDEENPSQDLRILSPTTEGFALARALAELPGLAPDAAAQALSLSCKTEALPE